MANIVALPWLIASSSVKKRTGIALFGTLLAVCCLVSARRPLPAITTEGELTQAALKSWFASNQQSSSNNNGSLSNDAIVVSPVGLLATAVLLWKLSAGETRMQLSRALDVHPQQRTHPADASFTALKAAAVSDGNVTVRLASAVFVDENQVKSLAVAASGVTSDAVVVPFARRPEEALRTINAWVAQQTNGQLRDPLPNGSVSAATALILVNALYFRASWLNAFTRLKTPLTFTDADGGRQTGVPGMAVITSDLRYLKTPDGTVVVSVPYGRTGTQIRAGFTAHFIIPPWGAFGYRRTIESLVARLDAVTTARLLDAVAQQRAITTALVMPLLELRAAFDVRATFNTLGVSSPIALGSGGGGGRGPHVDRIQQTVALSMNEAGTEGSAATVAFADRIMPSRSVRIESPFVLMVRHDATQHVLFYGVVNRVPLV